MKKILVSCFIAASLGFVPSSQAITILPAPSFTPSTNAPLAGLLQLSTDVGSRVSIEVDDGTNIWTRDFYDFGLTHSETLLGFKPGRTNQIQVTCYDKDRNASEPQSLTFVSAPLPADFPTHRLITNQPDAMEPGYTLFIIQRNTAPVNAYITALDNSGDVVWYKAWTTHDFDVRQLGNGDLFIQQYYPSNNFVELNMLGQTVRMWTAPAAYPVNDHEGLPTDHGTILYLSDVSRVVTNFPASTAVNAARVTKTIDDNPVVEISASNATVVHAWSPMDILDPRRITYLTYEFSNAYGVDNEHANGIIEDTNDDSLIVSQRDQNAVYKFSRATGHLKWILGPPANWGTNWQPYLLATQGVPFDWNYGQHAPQLTPQHTLLLYNDGNIRSSPPSPQMPDATNYSSAEEFRINETNMTVTEVWNSAWQTNQDRLFTGVLGMAQWLPKTEHVLVTYGSVSHINYQLPNPHQVNSTMVRLIEYTHDPVPQVVFDISFYDPTNNSGTYYGYLCYRSRRIPDLYTHPAQAVADMDIDSQNIPPSVKFSADPENSYEIQSSTDLVHWTTIGTPTQEESTGNFEFTDSEADESTPHYYRIVTN